MTIIWPDNRESFVEEYFWPIIFMFVVLASGFLTGCTGGGSTHYQLTGQVVAVSHDDSEAGLRITITEVETTGDGDDYIAGQDALLYAWSQEALKMSTLQPGDTVTLVCTRDGGCVDVELID